MTDAADRILVQTLPWCGSAEAAEAWYHREVLAGFGRTAAELVDEGRAEAVLGYLDRIAVGGYA